MKSLSRRSVDGPGLAESQSALFMKRVPTEPVTKQSWSERRTITDKMLTMRGVAERITLLRKYPEVAEALRYIRDENDWNSYYRAYEAIGKSGQIVDRGLVSKNECERFTSSARACHHKVHSPNMSSMTKEQGRVWITNVIRRLVASLLDEQ